MVDKPVKPSGEYTLKTNMYSEDGIIEVMTDNEYRQGKNMTGEIETPLGSVPNVHKDNYLLAYLTQHIIYLEQAVDYLMEKVGG